MGVSRSTPIEQDSQTLYSAALEQLVNLGRLFWFDLVGDQVLGFYLPLPPHCQNRLSVALLGPWRARSGLPLHAGLKGTEERQLPQNEFPEEIRLDCINEPANDDYGPSGRCRFEVMVRVVAVAVQVQS